MRGTFAIIALLAIGLSACGKQEESQTGAPPAPAPMETQAPEAPASPSAAVDGAAKFASLCINCHGANGQGMETFPKLAGLTAEIVKSRMADYKAGKQVGPQSAVMMPIASQLSDAEVEALANYIASLK
jgi:cytochrome c